MIVTWISPEYLRVGKNIPRREQKHMYSAPLAHSRICHLQEERLPFAGSQAQSIALALLQLWL
jgi:hypothetical protein